MLKIMEWNDEFVQFARIEEFSKQTDQIPHSWVDLNLHYVLRLLFCLFTCACIYLFIFMLQMNRVGKVLTAWENLGG